MMSLPPSFLDPVIVTATGPKLGAWYEYNNGHAAENIGEPSITSGDLLIVMYAGGGGTTVQAAPTGWTRIRNGSGFPHGVYVRIANGTSTDSFLLAAQAAGRYGIGQMCAIPTPASLTYLSFATGNQHTGAPSSSAVYPSIAARTASAYDLVVGVLLRFNDTTVRTYGPPGTPYTQIDYHHYAGGAAQFQVSWVYKLDSDNSSIGEVASGESPNGSGSRYGSTTAARYSA